MKLGLIGNNIAYSYSVRVHNLFGYDYSLCEVGADELEYFVKSTDYDAFNVTIPHKKTIIKYLDDLSPMATRLGAVNTVIKKDNRLIGYNTDYFGMQYMLNRAKINLKDKKVMILGSGGTSNTAFALATDKGARDIIVVGRNLEVNYANYLTHADCDILINTTPVGTYPNNASKLVELSNFNNVKGVVEVIYNPLMTALTVEAKKLKIKHCAGLVMLIAQAKKAKDLFFDKISDNHIIEKTYKTLRRQISNIVLVGMPSAGKSTIASHLAKIFDKKLVDTDAMIEVKTKMQVKDIINNKGEKAFRVLEKEAIREVAMQKGQVIATGGGAILEEENMNLLMQNGWIIYIHRNVEKLTTKDRPLSKNLQEMYKYRDPIYRTYADIIIDNNKDIDSCIRKIEVKVNEYLSN